MAVLHGGALSCTRFLSVNEVYIYIYGQARRCELLKPLLIVAADIRVF